jgi:hypothetical protein
MFVHDDMEIAMHRIHSHLFTATAAAALTSAFLGPLPGPVFTDEHLEVLSHMQLLDLPDGQGGLARTLRIKRVNVQIVNGLGFTTGGPPNTPVVTNGLGNLIVGYGEPSPGQVEDRTGSHNLLVGTRHAYAGVGGAAIGYDSEIAGLWGAALGGRRLSVDGLACVAVGGEGNEVQGASSLVAGGFGNTVDFLYSTVVGGRANASSSRYGAVVGGYGNGTESAAWYATIVGGEGNEVVGDGGHNVVVGGEQNRASGLNTFIGGGMGNETTSTWATVVGGSHNAASYSASVFGGSQNVAGEAPPMNALYPTVVGGRGNRATGDGATVGGGRARTAAGADDWVAGGLFQDS